MAYQYKREDEYGKYSIDVPMVLFRSLEKEITATIESLRNSYHSYSLDEEYEYAYNPDAIHPRPKKYKVRIDTEEKRLTISHPDRACSGLYDNLSTYKFELSDKDVKKYLSALQRHKKKQKAKNKKK